MRWHSSPVIREAARKLNLWVPEDAELDRYYILTAAGLASLVSDAARVPQARYPTNPLPIDPVRAATTLRLSRSGVLIRCERLEWINGRLPVRFYFPKTATQPIRPEDGDVEFDCLLGQVRLRAKFRLREMIWDGKLAL